MLTQSRLKELLHYNPETGVFTWHPNKKGEWPKSHAGKIAGCERTERDYTCILVRVDYRLYRAHQLAWLYMHGDFPEGGIDHKDGDATNNRISNLRPATQAINMQNLRGARKDNKLGLLGVCQRKDGKYIAQISKSKKNYFLGVFDCPKEAHAVYLEAKRKLHEGCTI